MIKEIIDAINCEWTKMIRHKIYRALDEIEKGDAGLAISDLRAASDCLYRIDTSYLYFPVKY